MEIRETLFSRSFSIESHDPYKITLEFMKKLSENYRIYERKNIFQTDGPVKKCVVIFDVLEALDKFSRIRVRFSMESENTNLYIDVVGEFVVKVHQSGFFSDMFAEFYLNKVFPRLKKVSEKRVKELEIEIGKM
jgi:hypothetical protein